MSERYKRIVLEEAGSQKAVDAYHAVIDAAQIFCQRANCLPGEDVLKFSSDFHQRVLRRWLDECDRLQ